MSRRLIVLFFAVASLLGPLVSRADILVNGSFEDPVVPANSFEYFRQGQFIGTNDGTPWIYSFHSAGPFVDLKTRVIADNFPSANNKTTPFGNQYYVLGETYPGNPSWITVTTKGVIGPALGHYELSFWQADLTGGTGGALQVDFRAGRETAFTSILAGGQQTFTTAAGSDWVRHAVEFDITFAGSFFIALTSVPGHFGLIDNVQLNLIPAAVPEPETYALMLAGLGLIGWTRRRRKQ